MHKTYIHITESERRRIERLLGAGETVRSIAGKLGRSPNSIGYEIRQNRVKGRYLARKAVLKARARRQRSKIQSLVVIRSNWIRNYTGKKLRSGWSPELVSGRLKKIHQKEKAPSPKAIYKFIRSVYGRPFEQYLASRIWKKKGGPKRKRSVSLDGRRMIGERPKIIEKRLEFGHFEMDFLESCRDGKGSILVLTERLSRYPFLAYIENRGTEYINALITKTLADSMVLSITTDNDLSFQKHQELSEMLMADIFFCDPYSSWQKGTVENRNRAVRKRLPKGTDFSQVSTASIMVVEHELRHRPMKVLGFKTPFEVWQEEVKKHQNKKNAREAHGMIIEGLKVNEKCPT